MKKLMKFVILVCLVGVLFGTALSHLERNQHREDKEILEEALRRSSVACYAAEGFYPPDIAYLQEHYGLQYDETRYIIHYERFASNLMPEITVLDKCL